MSFRRLSLMLRVPLAVLLCGQLVFLGGDFPPDDYLTSPNEVAVTFDELEDNKSFDKSFDVGLPGVILEDDLNQHFAWVSLDLGNVPQGVTLELHATGPPNA